MDEPVLSGPPIEEMTPNEFEHFVADLFRSKGHHVEVTPRTGDFGADLIVSNELSRTAVQVKHYCSGNNVGVQDVSHLHGARQYYRCDSALLITTSSCTRTARELAATLGVQLWDGGRFRAFVSHAGYAPNSPSDIEIETGNEVFASEAQHEASRQRLTAESGRAKARREAEYEGFLAGEKVRRAEVERVLRERWAELEKPDQLEAAMPAVSTPPSEPPRWVMPSAAYTSPYIESLKQHRYKPSPVLPPELILARGCLMVAVGVGLACWLGWLLGR